MGEWVGNWVSAQNLKPLRTHARARVCVCVCEAYADMHLGTNFSTLSYLQRQNQKINTSTQSTYTHTHTQVYTWAHTRTHKTTTTKEAAQASFRSLQVQRRTPDRNAPSTQLPFLCRRMKKLKLPCKDATPRLPESAGSVLAPVL